MRASESDGMSVVSRPWSLGRRFVTAACVFGAIGFVVFASAGTNTEGRVAGAGSTLVNPILQRVSTSYQGYLAADQVDVTQMQGQSNDWTAGASALDYDPVGSIGGLMRLSDPAVIFAATEIPLSAEELDAEGRVQFPLILGAAAPMVNLDLGGARMVLNADVLAAIYKGEITQWSDPAIAALNTGLALPDTAITVRHRRDGSGTTWTFTGYLAQSARWTAGQAAQIDWTLGEGADGSRGIIEAVKATPGAIGYAEVGQASRAGLSVVSLSNASGEIVEPSPQSIRTAATLVAWQPGQQIAAASVTQGWPMTATVYVVMRKEDSQTERALAFFRYFYTEAPRQADALGYVPLPASVVAEIEASWASLFNIQS